LPSTVASVEGPQAALGWCDRDGRVCPKRAIPLAIGRPRQGPPSTCQGPPAHWKTLTATTAITGSGDWRDDHAQPATRCSFAKSLQYAGRHSDASQGSENRTSAWRDPRAPREFVHLPAAQDTRPARALPNIIEKKKQPQRRTTRKPRSQALNEPAPPSRSGWIAWMRLGPSVGREKKNQFAAAIVGHCRCHWPGSRKDMNAAKTAVLTVFADRTL